LTARHLATREHPGEVTLVLGFLGFFVVVSALNAAYCLLVPPPAPSFAAEQAWVAVGNGVAALWLGACFLGLRRGAAWGWWLSVLSFGLFTTLCLLAVVLAVLEGRNDRVFANSLAGLVVGAVATLLTGAPFFLLVKARRRYLEWRALS
jgi:hypothetical protein